MLLNCGMGEDSWESLGLQGDPTSPSWRRSVLGVHWKDWCWSWNSSALATWYEELTHLKRPWCWERLRAGGEGDDRGWNGWMTSLTQWTWVRVNSRSWWWTGWPGVLQFMGLQRVRHDWVTELNLQLSHALLCKACIIIHFSSILISSVLGPYLRHYSWKSLCKVDCYLYYFNIFQMFSSKAHQIFRFHCLDVRYL